MEKFVIGATIAAPKLIKGEFILSNYVEGEKTCEALNLRTDFVKLPIKQVEVLSGPKEKFENIVFVDSNKCVKVIYTNIGSPNFFRYIRKGYHPSSILHHWKIKISEFTNTLKN
jgi:hypothetical protein